MNIISTAYWNIAYHGIYMQKVIATIREKIRPGKQGQIHSVSG